MPPAVSIIMNCLNCARDLPAALESVGSQTFQDYEVIFWDNCSTDESAAIAKAWGPKLRYFRGERTVPLGCARNLALAEARGAYVAFLDCDDLWRPTKLEKQVALFEADAQVGLVCTDTEIMDGSRLLSRVFAQSAPGRGYVFAELMERQWISMSSAMLRREALESVACATAGAGCWFDESLNVCEEADLFYRIAHDWKLDYIDEPLTIWRVHGGNTTFRKFGQFADETLRILEKHRDLYAGYDAEHGDLAALLTRRAAFQKAVALWREGRNAEARDAVRPWRNSSLKYRLFWAASYLPGACFDLAARVYFSLPAFLRR